MEELERKVVQMVGEQRERLLGRKDQLCTQLVSMLRMNDERFVIVAMCCVVIRADAI